MKCHIPGPNVKILGRTIHTLARFGDELYLESLPDSIHLRTLNSAESAYAMVKFNKCFFSYFNYNYYSTEDNEGLKCKISMKSALNTFKSPTHLNKQVENLEIKLDPDSCKLIFQLKCKHGIVKTHFVSILDCKSLQMVYTKDLVPNRLTSTQRIFSDALSNFQSSYDQVTIEASPQSLILRNYIDNNIDVTRVIRSQIVLNALEFENYEIELETSITFTLKEFKALLAFAEALNLPIQLHFETTGKPAVFIVHNTTTFEAHFVLSTSKPDNATAVSTQNTNVERSKRKDLTTQISVKKKHLDDETAKQLDEDSHLFNLIDVANETNAREDLNANNDIGKYINHQGLTYCDTEILPIPKIDIRSIFKTCFDNTFDPRKFNGHVFTDSSDCE